MLDVVFSPGGQDGALGLGLLADLAMLLFDRSHVFDIQSVLCGAKDRIGDHDNSGICCFPRPPSRQSGRM